MPPAAGLARQRAHSYWRTAEFFLSPKDPRRDVAWERQIANFNEGLDTLGVPYERFAVPFESGHLNAIYYRAEGGADKPLIVIAGGFDGTLEELYFMFGKDAVERGYNVLTYEGPGQCGLVRESEHVFHARMGEADLGAARSLRDGLFKAGPDCSARHQPRRLSGAARQPAFDDRIDGVIAFNVMYDFNAVCEPFRALAANPATRDLPGVHWAVENGCWVFGAETADEFVDATKPFALADVLRQDQGRCAHSGRRSGPFRSGHAGSELRRCIDQRAFGGEGDLHERDGWRGALPAGGRDPLASRRCSTGCFARFG